MTSLCHRALAGSGLDATEVERLLQVARDAAEAGGHELRRHFGRLEQVKEKGMAGNLVTEADLAAEAAVLAVLAAGSPGVAVLA